MNVFSPAKINLGLSIPYRRESDGYHQIESIFLRINWGDSMHISWSEDGNFHLTTDIELEGEARSLIEQVSSRDNWSRNLLFKTWNLARRTNPSLPGIHISLKKCIPPGGGLGGGSSNSASLWKFFIQNQFIEPRQAKILSLSLGADIPFFLEDTHCWVTGVGEILEPIQVAKGHGILVVPNIPLDTKTMYLNLKKSLQKPLPSKTWKEQEGSLLLALESGDWAYLNGILTNDFEKVAFNLQPSLKAIRDSFLTHGAVYSAMSGSGSTIYGLMRDEEHRNMLLPPLQTAFSGLQVVPFSF